MSVAVFQITEINSARSLCCIWICCDYYWRIILEYKETMDLSKKYRIEHKEATGLSTAVQEREQE